MKDYVRVQMKVIFIRAKSTVEENCYLEMYVGWSSKVVDESKPVKLRILNAKREQI